MKWPSQVLAANASVILPRSIDAARGKIPHFAAGQILGELIAASRARKDSVLAMMDLGGILGMITGAKVADLPVLMSLGFADRNAHIGIALPASTLRGAVSLARP